MPDIAAHIIAAGNEKARRLKDLLHAPEILVMPGAFNVISALIFQHLGFKAIQGSSAAIANAAGFADLGVGRERTVFVMQQIAAAVDLPVNADGEAGFGGPEDVRETVRQFVAAGVVGMNMEDGVHEEGKVSLLPLEEHMEKIAAFIDEREKLGSEFCLNARTDAFLVLRDDPDAALKEAVRRGQAFAEAGAECVFTWGTRDPEAIRTFAKEVPAPVSVIFPPGFTVEQLQELGVARVSYGSMFLYAAASELKRFAEEVLTQGTTTSLEGGLTRQEMMDILGGRQG
ncbi:MAG TPA: isocitrate lyase/phosphoenolpyruvate mutase family protein [Dehalococcoidia bacterium]|nr:isocitrate lyase/phosphoenolpyruvate mutase family protein [Dehalococcoidia bacterium]